MPTQIKSSSTNSSSNSNNRFQENKQTKESKDELYQLLISDSINISSLKGESINQTSQNSPDQSFRSHFATEDQDSTIMVQNRMIIANELTSAATQEEESQRVELELELETHPNQELEEYQELQIMEKSSQLIATSTTCSTDLSSRRSGRIDKLVQIPPPRTLRLLHSTQVLKESTR